MTTPLVAPSRSRWALLALCCAALSCKDEPDRVGAFVAATDELQEALCACAPNGFECEESSVASACEQRVVRKHEEKVASWLACATRELRAQAECVRSSECAGDDLDACRPDVDDACGDPPEAGSQAIERDIEKLCTEPIDCADGSTASGRFCNGDEECSDGSDEAGCDGSSSGGSGSADPVFVCLDGSVTSAEFVCDGIADCVDASDESAGAGCASTVLPPPTQPGTAFTCSDGNTIPVAFVCDGAVSCSDGADEAPCFTCNSDPSRRVRAALTCDGVPDCPDGSDEQICSDPKLPPPPPVPANAGAFTPPLDMCVAGTQPPPSINPSCVRCGCSAAPMQVIACDQTCWALIDCVLELCPDVAGTPDQSQCAIDNCSEHLSGAANATTLGPALTQSCADVCPPF